MKRKCLSGSSLKVIAMVTMVIDHTACYFISSGWQYECMRGIGRMAFPIFAFLIAEGYRHTRRGWDYGRHLLIFAFISEMPWMLLHTVDRTTCCLPCWPDFAASLFWIS